MTATAATEIDVLDFEAAGSGGYWERALSDVMGPMRVPLRHRRGDAARFRSREVGDIQFADWNCPPVEGVLSLGKVRDAQRDVVVWAGFPGDDGDGCTPPERVVSRTLTMPRAVLVAAGCDANFPACLVLEPDRPLVGVLLMVLDEVWSRLPAMSAREVEATRGHY